MRHVLRSVPPSSPAWWPVWGVATLKTTLCEGRATSCYPLVDMTAILGISAFYHDSAAAVVVDGEIVAAAQEERVTRQKHDAGFPEHAIAYCLKEADRTVTNLDYVAFYEKPFMKFDRLLRNLPLVRARGAPKLQQGASLVVAPEAPPATYHPQAARWVSRTYPFPGPPRESRRKRLFPQPI